LKYKTIIQSLGDFKGNRLWMKREDLIPFSFGGNKARKVQLFLREIEQSACDSVVTYGSGSSNHCRVVANICCQRGLKCCVISPKEVSKKTFNSRMMELFGAEIITVPVDRVHDTIEEKLNELSRDGYHPYFIEGGGHGNIGTEAYVQCYGEIKEQEKELGVFFDYIFFASGTGTTHAGLVCGQIMNGDERKVVGISIARKNPRGRDVVLKSIKSYLGEDADMDAAEGATIFVDDYANGYGKRERKVEETVENVLKQYGIPLDMTYTGKAFWGMGEYLAEIRNKNVLFIHTGGTPLFFDIFREEEEYEHPDTCGWNQK
jgi:D-cysteine desulfhydrase